MEFFKKKWILAIIFVLAAGFVVVVFRYLESAAKASYEFVEAKKTDVKKTISVSGTIKPIESVDLAFEKTGKVAAISVQVGDEVKAGQQLAILDQTDYSDQVSQAMASLQIAQAGLLQAEATLKKEKKKRTELENTHQSKYTVDVQRAQIKSAQAAVDIEQAKIAKARADLKYYQDQHEKITLLSPIDGMVTAKNIEVGETAGPTETAISVISENNFRVEADISQVNISEVEAGEKAKISLDSCPVDETIESQVVSVDPAETRENGNSVYRADLEIGKISDCAKPGSSANVEIVTQERKNVLAVPSASLIKRDNRYFVLVQDGERGLKEKEVKVGIQGSSGMAEIISGIEEGEKVVSFSK